MANFFDKLKKGMKIKKIENEAESVAPLLPEELDQDELEKKIEKEEEDNNNIGEIKTAGIKNFVLSNVKEVEKKARAKGANKPEKIITKAKEIENWLEPEGQLVIDVYETGDEIVIQSAIAGIIPENLDICIEKDMVSIRGKREEATEKIGKNYLIEECYWGSFSREIILPTEVDASKAEASMKNGILTIRAPKIEMERKKVTVR